MYHHLRGRVAKRTPAEVVLEVGGVGYRLRVPLSTFERLPAEGGEAELLTHLVVREDAHDLFGFATHPERLLFRRLIRISGVGPNVALTLLSGAGVDGLVEAVRAGEGARLRGVRGIGPKTAERVVLEMRGAVEDLAAASAPAPAGTAAADATAALLALGYSGKAAAEAVRRAERELGPGAAVEALVRAALAFAK